MGESRPKGRGDRLPKALQSQVPDFFSCPFPDLNLYLFCRLPQVSGGSVDPQQRYDRKTNISLLFFNNLCGPCK